ncbi:MULTISPECIES: DUF1254 domain-containing protein [Ramlibacter]|uniref:DUF1254 domain-containing protein n=1 Tax=Ramlibacter pinisoli TaxID=2682844 RepID=A0A6N8ISA3_9BURK|nr:MULTISPECIES: DUF1254 domain-containing protein [Ramlibacter]MBA2963787.1 DUF1254 domain-containing protein [Ramlibacter sp. CGMCC 1.13660]MVQ28753.1 DUF1254 domain-containing protein [Ramlibacter pinisoli]
MKESALQPEALARALSPAHADLPDGAGAPARLANEKYVESLARILFYWGYPAVNTYGRTSCWEAMKGAGPGATLGLFPGAPKNHTGYLDDYMSALQRKVVTPNNDTIYGACFADLAEDSVVLQTPSQVPPGHYWTVQMADLFTTVTHQIGSASRTPGGKFLVVGPDWQGEKPPGFLGVLRSPTNLAVLMFRCFAARTPEAKAQARSVLNQLGAVPQKEDRPGPLRFDCEASARNKVFPRGLTADMLAADPDLLRHRPVNALTFWDDLQVALDANPRVSTDDAPMAAQARVLLALRAVDPAWRALVDRTTLAANAELHESAKYHQAGAAAGNGWQRQENGGAWGSDWFGRAQAAVIYIYVNDFHEAIYFIRGTDAQGELLQGRYRYTVTFPKGALPPVDRDRGGFWSLTMYDQDYFMVPDSPNGRHNIGTVNLDANELAFASDGSLVLHLSHAEPPEADARANWLPAPAGQFALLVRTYVPTPPLLDGSYRLPDVQKSVAREA